MLENRNVIGCLHLYVPTVDMIAINAERCLCVTDTISGVIAQMVEKSW